MSEKPQKFYSMAVRGREADIYIFGDILTPDWKAFDEMFGIDASRSGYDIMKEIRDLDVDVINVHINSYGGHVSEGIAIHNVLVEHKADIITFDDGFACSAASVVYMAGKDRVVYETSLLMIHNAWCYASGNADQLRKAATDLEIISATAAAAYRAKINISDAELDNLLKNETWIAPADALKWGFATEIRKAEQSSKPAASAMSAIMRLLTTPQPGQTPTEELLKSLQSKLVAIEAAISLQPQAPKQEPTPAPKKEPKVANKPMTFVNALLGGKEDK